MIANIGDVVFVPHAYDMKFTPHMSAIEEIGEDGEYYCKVPILNMAGRRHETRGVWFKPTEVFINKKECQKYIDNYYYDGLCKECEWEKVSGEILRCNGCCNYELEAEGLCRDTYKCAVRGCRVGVTYGLPNEACAEYVPRKIGGVSWKDYETMLKMCDFNPNCPHHKYSAHKTIGYDKYLSEFVNVIYDYCRVRICDIEYTISGLVIRRESWINGDYIKENGYMVNGVIFEKEVTIRKKNVKSQGKLLFNKITFIEVL